MLVGQQQIDDREVGAGDGGAVECLLGARADQDLVAGIVEDQRQRAADLGVVIADEDSLAGHQAPLAAGPAAVPAAAGCSAGSGSSTMKVVPRPP